MKTKPSFKKALEQFDQLREVVHATTPVDSREPEQEKAKRIKRLLGDYNAFIKYYLPRYVTEEATGRSIDCGKFQIDAANKVLKDKNIMAILEWAREHAKSVHANIGMPLFLKAHGQLRGMVLVGNNFEAAARLLSDIQLELEENQRYNQDFGIQKGTGSWADGEFTTLDGTAFVALGRGQSPRGIRNRNRRPNYCVIDDIDDDQIVNNQERVGKVVKWILGALIGALHIGNRRIVVAGNRIHRKSILAHLVGDQNNPKEKRKGIYHSKVVAIVDGKPVWKERYSLKDLQDNIDLMGYAVSQTEYFHNPITEGKLFRYEWIRWATIPRLSTFDKIVCYTDPSFKATSTSDYKAVKVWGVKGKDFYLIDCFVRQCSVSTMVRWTYDIYEKYLEESQGIMEFWIEANFIQDQLLDDYDDEGDLRGYQLPIMGDDRKKPEKMTRIVSMQPYYERGHVIYNQKKMADFDFKTAVEHLTALEYGSSTADDSPDADEGAWYFLRGYQAATSGGDKHRFGKRNARPY
jgi:predicted phage terminase large subunit-like protein